MKLLNNLMLSLLISITILITPVFAFDSNETRQSLKDISGVYVLIEDFSPNLNRKDFKFAFDTKKIQNDVELLLQNSGIKTLSWNEMMNIQRKPMLYININLHEYEKYWYAYDIKIEFYQIVCMLEKPSIKILAATWSTNMTGVINSSDVDGIKGNVRILLKSFIIAYDQVNKKIR